MDPATILSIVNGSLGLAVKIGTVVNDLYTLSKRLNQAQLTLESIASECEMVQAAWEGIQTWAEKQPAQQDEGRQRLLDRLTKSLHFGNMVFGKLEEDLKEFMTEPQNTGFFRRTKIVWNEDSFAQHQNRIRGQVTAMTLLLQVIDLPSSTEQTEQLIKDDKIFTSCDESAWTIIDSDAYSYSIKHPDARASMESSETVYRKLDFEPELMTGRAYGRSYKFLAKNMTKTRGKGPLRDVKAKVSASVLDVETKDVSSTVFGSQDQDLNSLNGKAYSKLKGKAPVPETPIRLAVNLHDRTFSQLSEFLRDDYLT